MKITSIVTSAIVFLGAWHTEIISAVAADAAGGPSNSINPLTFDPDLAWFTLVVFVLLLLILTKFAWKPLMAGLDQRERTMANMIDEAKRNHEEAAQKLLAYEQKLATAAAEAHEVLVQARRDAATAGEKMLEAARADANRERLRALADIETAKNTAVQQIAEQSANLAFALARKLIHKELRPEDHTALIRESLEQFPSEN
jgi:F-type H+-transporting ATPase subunit b